jgi:DNA-binding NarL/FixJ family response regulator
MRVLIIDDHAIVRHGIASLLRESFADLETGEAGDAREGLEEVLQDGWDLVIADISMPGRDGLDLIRDIRRDKPETPVLVVSSHAESDYAVRAIKAGASGYVSKSAAADRLIAAVRRVLSGRRYISPELAERLAENLAGDGADAGHESLSNRELQVLQLIASGRSIKEIAADLALSEKTVATYRSRIAAKMGLGSNVDLTRYALRHGLVE